MQLEPSLTIRASKHWDLPTSGHKITLYFLHFGFMGPKKGNSLYTFDRAETTRDRAKMNYPKIISSPATMKYQSALVIHRSHGHVDF